MQFQKGRAQLSRAKCKCAPPCRGAHLSAGGCERYSAIVRTTLEVGRVSLGAPPVALTALRTCSSYEAIVVTGDFGFMNTIL